MTTVLTEAPSRRPRATKSATPEQHSGGGSPQRNEEIRVALLGRLDELNAEHAVVVGELEISGVVDAGDDIADLGTKAFTREQEMVLVTTIRGRIDQVERAIGRLAQGRYGWCESCSKEIPVARLAAFPSVTLCIGCKQLEERR